MSLIFTVSFLQPYEHVPCFCSKNCVNVVFLRQKQYPITSYFFRDWSDKKEKINLGEIYLLQKFKNISAYV